MIRIEVYEMLFRIWLKPFFEFFTARLFDNIILPSSHRIIKKLLLIRLSDKTIFQLNLTHLVTLLF